MAECNFVERISHETPNMYANLNTTPSNEQQFRLNKIKLKIILLLRLKKEQLSVNYL